MKFITYIPNPWATLEIATLEICPGIGTYSTNLTHIPNVSGIMVKQKSGSVDAMLN